MYSSLEQVLIPQIHDDDCHEVVVSDEETQTQFCFECAMDCFKSPNLLTIQKRRLLIGMSAGFTQLDRIDEAQGTETDRDEHGNSVDELSNSQKQATIELPCKVVGDRIIRSYFEHVVLRCMNPIDDVDVIPILLKTTMQLFAHATLDEQTVMALYEQLLHTCRANGIRESLHIIQLLSTMLENADNNGPILHFDHLLENIEGEDIWHHNNGTNGHPSLSFATSLVAFVDLVAGDCFRDLCGASKDGKERFACNESGGRERQVQLLRLLLLLVRGPRTKALLLREGVMSRHMNRIQSLSNLGQGSLGAATLIRSVEGAWIKAILALSVVLIPSPDPGPFTDITLDTTKLKTRKRRLSQRNLEPLGRVAKSKETTAGLLPWHTTLASTLAKDLIISADLEVAFGAGSYLLLLLSCLLHGPDKRGNELAEELIRIGLVEFCLEGIRNVLRFAVSNGHQTQQQRNQEQGDKITLLLCRLMWTLSRAQPLGFYGSQRFSPSLFKELVELLQGLAENESLARVSRLSLEMEDPHELLSYEETESKDWLVMDASAPNLVLSIIHASLTQTRVIYDEDLMGRLLQVLRHCQNKDNEEHPLNSQQDPTSSFSSTFPLQLLLFLSEYLGAISNKLLFPSHPILESFLHCLKTQIIFFLCFPICLPSYSKAGTTFMLTLALANLRVLDILSVRHYHHHQPRLPPSQPNLLSLLLDAAMQLLVLFSGTERRSPGDEYAICHLYSKLLLLMSDAEEKCCTTECMGNDIDRDSHRLSQLLLDTGVFEMAIQHISYLEEGENVEEKNVDVFSQIAARLLTDVSDKSEGLDPCHLTRFVRQNLRTLHSATLSDEIAEIWLWLLAQDLHCLCRWEAEDLVNGCSRFELLLLISRRVWRKRRPHVIVPGEEISKLLISWGKQAQQAREEAYLGRILTPLSIKLILDLALGGSSVPRLAPEVRAGLQTVLQAFCVRENKGVDTFCSIYLSCHGPSHLHSCLALADATGVQFIVHRWMDQLVEDKLNVEISEGSNGPSLFARVLHTYFNTGAGDGRSVLLALLQYMKAASSHRPTPRLAQALTYLYTASCWSQLWASCADTCSETLQILHDMILPVLVDGSSILEGQTALRLTNETKEENQIMPDVQTLAVQVIQIVKAALQHAAWSADFTPVLKTTSRILLLATAPPLKNPHVGAALLALINDITRRGHDEFLNQCAGILDLAWSFESASPRLATTNALLYCLLLLHHRCTRTQAQLQGLRGEHQTNVQVRADADSFKPSWLSHAFFRIDFLETCIQPDNDDEPTQERRRVALALLCLMMTRENRTFLTLSPSKLQGEKWEVSKDSSAFRKGSTKFRKMRLNVQACLLDSDARVRECAMALLLQLWDYASPTAWDIFLLQSPPVISSLASGTSSYAPLFVAACLLSGETSIHNVICNPLGNETFLVDHLVARVQAVIHGVRAGERDSLPAYYPSLLYFFQALTLTGHIKHEQQLTLQRILKPSSLKNDGRSGNKSDTQWMLAVDDARLVDYDESACQEQGLVDVVKYMDYSDPHDRLRITTTEGLRCGSTCAYPTHPREVDLKKVVETLRTMK